MSKIHISVIHRACKIADSVEIRKYCTLHESQLGEKVMLHERVTLKRVSVASRSFINTGSYLENVIVGERVQIGANCSLPGVWHKFDEKSVSDDDVFTPITLKNGCLLGAAVVVVPGVTIGEGAVVGAGAIVTKDIPDHHIYWGVPPNHTLLSISDYLKRKRS